VSEQATGEAVPKGVLFRPPVITAGIESSRPESVFPCSSTPASRIC